MAHSSIENKDNNTLSGATNPGQSGTGSNGNKELLHIPQSSRAKASASVCLVSYLDTHGGRVLLFCREGVGILYNLS